MLVSELASMSAIAQTEDERSESEVASEIEHSQSTERAIARSVTVIACQTFPIQTQYSFSENPQLSRLEKE